MKKKNNCSWWLRRTLDFIVVVGALVLQIAPDAVADTLKERMEEAVLCPYTVKKGDTLITIALRLTGNRENYRLIMELNGLTSDRIYPGNVLNIPNDLLLEEYQCKREIQPEPVPTSLPTPTPLPIPIPTVTPSPTPTITPQPTLTPPPKESERKIRAEIEGIVFEDSNKNGKPDLGEFGIPNIEVVLIRDVLKVRSDEQGKFLFTEIDPGEQAVGLHETTLPDGYHLCTDSTVVVGLSEGDRGFVSFGLQSDFSSIVILVYHDANQNGRYDPKTEQGLEGVQLQVDETMILSTDAQGQIILRHLLEGTYTFTLRETSLPAQYRLATEASVPVALKSGVVKHLEFGVILKP